jgi:hypothetical protein
LKENDPALLLDDEEEILDEDIDDEVIDEDMVDEMDVE